jgi:hypothetical protein
LRLVCEDAVDVGEEVVELDVLLVLDAVLLLVLSLLQVVVKQLDIHVLLLEQHVDVAVAGDLAPSIYVKLVSLGFEGLFVEEVEDGLRFVLAFWLQLDWAYCSVA